MTDRPAKKKAPKGDLGRQSRNEGQWSEAARFRVAASEL